MLISCKQHSGSAAVPTLLIRIDLGGFPKNILTLIPPGDVISPANWFLLLSHPVTLHFAVLMMDMKVVFVSFVFGKFNPGWKKNPKSDNIHPLWQKCVCYLPRYWQTLKVRPCVSSITREGLLHYNIVSYRGGFVQIATANCVSCILAHEKKGLSQRKEIKFLPFCMFSLKKREKKSSKLWENYYW